MNTRPRAHGDRLHVVVAGTLTLPPFTPGTAWDRLQYVVGLRDLGHRVTFVEHVEPGWCRDGRGRPCLYRESRNRASFHAVTTRFGLWDDACQLYDGGRDATGLSRPGLLRRIRRADLLLNISGHLRSADVLGAVSVRAYLDQDPGYTQVWDTVHGADLGLDDHETLLTVGLAVGTPTSPVPTGGRTWHPCLPPVVLAHWPAADGPAHGPLTTVASFGRYADLAHDGIAYTSKQESFLRFAALPRLSGRAFEVDLRDADARSPTAAVLRDHGWTVRDARRLGDLDAYRRHLGASTAEIGIAKGAYVNSRSGWVGDRTAHYLASGRPVLAQSTGQEAFLPVGRGLRTFHDLDEAVEGVRAIHRDARAEGRAARQVARDHLDHRRVLPGLLATAMASARART